MKKHLMIIASLLLVSGCAFGTRRPYLDYQTTTPVKAQNNISISVDPLVDNRTWSKEKIGNVKNGYGMSCADIVPQNSVTEWIGNALKDELKNSGYNVVASGAPNVVSGEVNDVFCDAYFSYTGRVGFHLFVKKEGNVLLDKNYAISKNTGVSMAATDQGYANTMKFTLQDSMKQVMDDINKVDFNVKVTKIEESDKSSGLYTELTKLDDLRKKGILTEDEFQAQKKLLLEKQQ